MKKFSLLISLCLLSLCFISGCSSKKKTEVKKREQTITKSKEDSTTKSSQSNIKENSKQSDENELAANDSPNQNKNNSNNPHSAPAITQTQNDILSGYSQEYIEYARVWLAVMGADYFNYIDDSNFNFNLNVQAMPAGSPINRFDENSVTYPVDTIHLSGNASVQGAVVYASNYNGTVTLYDTPSHWQYPEEIANDPAALKALSQDVIDRAKIVPVPAGNPDSVKRLMDTIIIH